MIGHARSTRTGHSARSPSGQLLDASGPQSFELPQPHDDLFALAQVWSQLAQENPSKSGLYREVMTRAVTPTGQTVQRAVYYRGPLCRRCLAAMGERQPVGQLLRGFVGGLPVERHHGSWDTGGPKELCAPTVADRRDLDEVRAPGNGLFEAMCGHVCDVSGSEEEARSYAPRAGDQAKRNTKPRPHRVGRQCVEASFGKNICDRRFSTAFARAIHSFSTRGGVLDGMMCGRKSTMRHRAGVL